MTPHSMDQLKKMKTQAVKNLLHRLTGRPENVDKKNTPPKYGKRNREIFENVYRLSNGLPILTPQELKSRDDEHAAEHAAAREHAAVDKAAVE